MSDYNPGSLADRTELATRFIAGLKASGYAEIKIAGTRERVFARTMSNRAVLQVYTSVVGTAVRQLDKDAIRFSGIYVRHDGQERTLLPKMSRVYRTGTIDRILERVQERLFAVEEELARIHTCRRCGTPMFKSKAGKLS